MLSPYLQEAFSLLAEGVDTAYIDETARAFGMPMGPLELADTVGLDICLHVGEILAAAFGGEVPGVLREQVTRGRLGVKSKAGFYEHGKRRRPAAKGRRDVAAADVRDRLVLRMVNEAVACLREGIVADADLVDVGMVFGTGFAPFRGGPLNYARERGVSEVLTRLRQLEALDLPSIGSNWRLDVYSQAGFATATQAAIAFVGLAPASVQLPPYGVLGVDPAQLVLLPSVTLPAPAGAGTTVLPIPAVSSLVGLVLYAQAGVQPTSNPADARFTNVLEARIGRL